MNPVGLMDAGKLAEAVFLYVFNIVFPVSLLQYFFLPFDDFRQNVDSFFGTVSLVYTIFNRPGVARAVL